MKVRDALRKLGVFNQHGFYGRTPYLYQRSAVPRAVTPAAWSVVRNGERLSSLWYDHGAKTFSYTGSLRSDQALVAREEAIRWATERWQIACWGRDPFGGVGPYGYIVERLQQLGVKYRVKEIMGCDV